MKRSVTVKLSQFAFEALSGGAWNGSLRAQDKMVAAIRCYVGDRGSDRAGWRFPTFLGHDSAVGAIAIDLSIDEDLWRAFEDEADAQGVSAQRMAEHAALYFVAEFNAGHLTERMLGDLEEVA